MNYIFPIAMFAGGFAASIFTWPKLKLWANGAMTEATNLRAKAAAIEAAVKAKV